MLKKLFVLDDRQLITEIPVPGLKVDGQRDDRCAVFARCDAAVKDVHQIGQTDF